MLAFQRDIARFEALNAQVLGISGDNLETHRRFAGEYGISYPLLSDSDRAISRQYGGGRITYIIDRAGIIRYVAIGVPDNDALLRQLERLAD
ncbi:MAG: redoxin domain-containing protein [Pelovirga sp.]